MIVTAWILFVFFALMALVFTVKLGSGATVNRFETFLLLFSVFVVAIAAGVLFGGLTLL